jgi:DNA-binding YbaB/EbfC family protein
MFGLDQKAIMLQMQQALELSKMKLEQTTVVGEAGGGLVRIELNGNRKLTSLQINTSIKEMEKEDLEDLLTIALGRAMDEANKINENEVASSARQFIPGI